MRVLLDTHVLLWAVLDDPRLSPAQAAAIGAGELYLSAASVWENRPIPVNAHAEPGRDHIHLVAATCVENDFRFGGFQTCS